MSDLEGYLIIETRGDRPGLVRVFSSPQNPTPSDVAAADPTRPRIRYAAFFPALHVARMHAQTALRRSMLDAEAGLYRTDPVTAAAAVDAIDLSHRRVYLAPEIESDPGFRAARVKRSRRHRLANHIWTAVGVLALILLFLFAQIPVF
ncbi:hypothetical protein [Thiocapsa marina]|uniref:Uncharacterized protein n=1 Tax=Thiocapsa marina 5811 TaxID=768671 RepID=F9UG58_9GAMM|nr:hypothetical protein [Thiocapsa marina]EGV16784.1 hypothetical protein ThimaDRAFT_3911 [Thiocapsa marina 5811]